jgi:NAD(P)-dependent dehydrogenase (short-subunit alcohol dehydrogenase family)
MKLFKLNGKNAIVMGGGGILGAEIAGGLASAGANVAVCDLREENAQAVAGRISSEKVTAKGYQTDAMDIGSVRNVKEQIIKEFGSIDILVNAVGGNMKAATTSDQTTFFDLPPEALRKVIDLNLMAGAVIPSQVFGSELVANENGGVIVNISSMNYYRPLTRTPGYSAAKAAVSNFTQWLAVDLARQYGEKIRVNAVAPGFFLTDQNRYLLTDPGTGELTMRGKQIIEHTPMARFGDPRDLIGTLIWLVSDASRFVTGITVPVDGGFSSFSGV